MPTLPNIALPIISLPTVDVPRRRPARRITPTSPSPSPSRAPRATVKREVREVQKKIALAAGTFYEVGAQLNTWKKTQSWRALSPATSRGDFRAFVIANVMAYSTASRLMTVAATYPKTMAVKLGIEKGFQLARYARLTETRAVMLVRQDVGLGSPPTPVSELSALRIRGLVKGLDLNEARAAAPRATREDKRVARVFARRFMSELGVDADVHVDKKRNKLCLELDLDLARGAI